jgi:hypothetical protein
LKKHQCQSVFELAQKFHVLGQELESTETLEQLEIELAKDVSKLHVELLKLARKLHDLRLSAAKNLTDRAKAILEQLAMPHAQIQFEIELSSSDKDGNFDFEELTKFLSQIHYIHNRTIRLTQKEYEGREFEEADILDYHKLRIENISQNSPLKLVISFALDYDYVIPYLTALKIFFKLCKKYGATTVQLENTVTSIRNTLFATLRKFEVLNTKNIDKVKDDLFYSKFMHLMDDEKFRKAYNSFCKTGITITKFLSITEHFFGSEVIQDDILE